MFILSQITVPRTFGGEKLFAYGAIAHMDKKIGQLFTVSATEKLNSVILNGTFAGSGLREVFRDNPSLFGYDRYGAIFPFMIDFIDSSYGALCYQTHPTKRYAQQHLSMPFGKNESWYFIDPPTLGKTYANCKVQNRTQAMQALQKGLYREFIDEVPVSAGDYMYVPAGTLHAIGAGALVFEIQQAHPKTFNFYDFDRVYDGEKRALNWEEGLENLVFSSSVVSRPMNVGDVIEEEDYGSAMVFLRESFQNTRDVFCALTLLEGMLSTQEGMIRRGVSVLLSPKESVQFDGEALAMVNWPK